MEKMERENRQTVAMGRASLEAQKTEQLRAQMAARHEIKLREESAASEGKMKKIEAELESEISTIRFRTKDAERKLKSQATLEELRARTEIVCASQDSREYHSSLMKSEAFIAIGSGENTRVVLAPLDTLQLAAQQPVVHAMLHRSDSRDS